MSLNIMLYRLPTTHAVLVPPELALSSAPPIAEPFHEHPSGAQANHQQDEPEQVIFDGLRERRGIVNEPRLPADGACAEHGCTDCSCGKR